MSEPRLSRPVIHWYAASTIFDRHPNSGGFDEVPENELDIWIERMKRDGFDPNKPIELAMDHGALKIFDGWNRYRAAKKAKVEFATCTLSANEDLEDRQLLANVDRRHETEQGKEKRRRARLEKVVDLRKEGKSQRAIAEELKITPAAVQRDIEKATVSGDTVEPKTGLTLGKDAKLRPSSRSSKPIKELQLSKKPKPEKNGQILFDWKQFNAHFGALLREVDLFGKAYGCKETSQAEGLRTRLDKWRQEFKQWAEFKSKAKEE